MEIEEGLRKVANRQFEMIGEDMTFERLPQDGMITVSGKKMMWYNYYKFTEEQEREWKQWLRKELEMLGETSCEKTAVYVELRYGFTVRYKKEGELF